MKIIPVDPDIKGESLTTKKLIKNNIITLAQRIARGTGMPRGLNSLRM